MKTLNNLSKFIVSSALSVGIVSSAQAQTKKTKAKVSSSKKTTTSRVAAPAKKYRPTQSSAGVSTSTVKNYMNDENWMGALRALGSTNDAASRSLRATLFDKMGYTHSALAELVASYRLRPNATVLNRIGGLAFFLNETRLIQGLPTNSNGMKLALSAEALMAGDIQRAKGLLPNADFLANLPPSALKAKATIFASAVHNAVGNVRDALVLLGGSFPETAGVDLGSIRLQRALVLFEVGKYSEALDELKYITRSSPAWYRGQIVGAWSAFHAEDYNLSLGQLMNLHSPFLAGKFNPEKHLLRAVVLFQLCHYDSASRALKKLRDDYANISSSFQKVSSATDAPARFYGELKTFASGKLKQSNSGLDLVWDGIASQPIVADLSNSIEKIKFERQRIDQDFRTRELQGTRSFLLKVFEKVEDSYETRLARYSKALVDKMKNDVKESLEGALAVDLEVNTRLRDRLIRAQAPVQKTIDFKKELTKGYEFWPFEGEFWRDETGGYAFATSDVCEEGVR